MNTDHLRVTPTRLLCRRLRYLLQIQTKSVHVFSNIFLIIICVLFDLLSHELFFQNGANGVACDRVQFILVLYGQHIIRVTIAAHCHPYDIDIKYNQVMG